MPKYWCWTILVLIRCLVGSGMKFWGLFCNIECRRSCRPFSLPIFQWKNWNNTLPSTKEASKNPWRQRGSWNVSSTFPKRLLLPVPTKDLKIKLAKLENKCFNMFMKDNDFGSIQGGYGHWKLTHYWSYHFQLKLYIWVGHFITNWEKTVI
jgi:hypothetical protein